MTKEEMVQVLRSVGCNENTVAAMENAFDIGAANERKACYLICIAEAEDKDESEKWTDCAYYLSNKVADRGEL